MKKIIIVGTFIFIVLLTGCVESLPTEDAPVIGNESSENQTVDFNQSPEDVVKTYLEVYSNPGENLDVYVHPESPNRKKLVLSEEGEKDEEFIRDLRNRTTFTQIETKVISRESNERAVVQVTGVTELQQGNSIIDESFTENVVLKVDRGRWKIWSAKRLD